MPFTITNPDGETVGAGETDAELVAQLNALPVLSVGGYTVHGEEETETAAAMNTSRKPSTNGARQRVAA